MKPSKWIIAGISIVLLLALAIPAAANGAPVKIFLNFLPEFSNYGSTTANGTVLISIGEAWVDLSAQGMPQLTDESYEAWIVEIDTQKPFSVGKFNADAEGNINYFVQLDDIPVTEYRYFYLTVEPEPDSNPAEPDARIALAGLFPDPRLEIVDFTPTPTIQLSQIGGSEEISGTGETGKEGDEGAGAGTGQQGDTGESSGINAPATLPVTGVAVTWPWLGVGIVILGVLGMAVLKRT